MALHCSEVSQTWGGGGYQDPFDTFNVPTVIYPPHPSWKSNMVTGLTLLSKSGQILKACKHDLSYFKHDNWFVGVMH